jgi:hypothetical protein
MDDELIDFFAGLAMLGTVSTGKLDVMTGEWIAKRSYAIADAMMKERKERMEKNESIPKS